MDYNKTYVCKKCKTVYGELPYNREGESQCGTCLNIDCFEEYEISDTRALLISIAHNIVSIINTLDKIAERL